MSAVVRVSAAIGAALLAVPLTLSQLGEYEGGDVLVTLLPLALGVGGALGAAAGLLIRHRTRPRDRSSRPRGPLR